MKLYIDTKKVYAARERQKELLEKKECTFKPKINASPNRHAGTANGSKTTRQRSIAGEVVSHSPNRHAEKLYRQHRVKQRKLED